MLAPRGISPWAVWALFVAMQMTERRRWCHRVLQTNLREFWKSGEKNGKGPIPGIPEWQFSMFNSFCLMSHTRTGEVHSLDFGPNDALKLTPTCVTHYLTQLRIRDAIQERAVQLHPTIETIRLAIDELLELGALVDAGNGSFVVARSCQRQVPKVATICSTWSNREQQFRFSLAIGDWSSAIESMTSESMHLLKELTHLDNSTRQERLTHLMKTTVDQQSRLSQVISVFDEENSEYLSTLIERALDGPASSPMICALRVIYRRKDEAWCKKVLEIVSDLSPNGSRVEATAWCLCVKFLLASHFHTEEVALLLELLTTQGLAEMAGVAREFLPTVAPSLYFKALMCDDSRERCEAAAELVAIDEGWCVKVLKDAIDENFDEAVTSAARAALVACNGNEGLLAVFEWDHKNPDYSIGRAYSLNDCRERYKSPHLDFLIEQKRAQLNAPR